MEPPLTSEPHTRVRSHAWFTSTEDITFYPHLPDIDFATIYGVHHPAIDAALAALGRKPRFKTGLGGGRLSSSPAPLVGLVIVRLSGSKGGFPSHICMELRVIVFRHFLTTFTFFSFEFLDQLPPNHIFGCVQQHGANLELSA